MKKIISLLAAMALSFASVTAFAAPAAESDNIHVKFVADKATVAPGGDVKISAFVSANGNADVSFDTLAMIGLIYDEKNFTVKSMTGNGFGIDEYTDSYDYGYVWASDEEGNEHSANVASFEVVFTANVDAAEATYDFNVETDSAETGFSHGLFVYDSDKGNVTLTGTTVEVKAAGGDEGDDDEPVVTDPTATKNNDDSSAEKKIDAYDIANVDSVKRVLIFTEKQTTLTDKSRFVVTSGDRTQEFGGDIWDRIGNVEGDGGMKVDSVTFGLIVDANAKAADFTFSIK